MALALIIWLVTSLDSIATMVGWFSFLAFIFAGVHFIYAEHLSLFHLQDDDPDKPHAIIIFRRIKRLIITGFACIIIAVSIPKERTAWMMLGGYVAQTAYQSEIGEKLRSFVSHKLDMMIAESIQTDLEKKTKEKK